MSGGAFEYNQYKITDIADEIQRTLDEQGTKKNPNEWLGGAEYYEKYPEELINHTYPKEIQEKFKDAIKALRIASIYAQRIDWFISGDDGEESFLKRLNEDLEQ